MTEHTPGPWVVDLEEMGGSLIISPEGHPLDPWIADAKCEHVGPKSRAEIIANARLIAAAPDLLEALKAFVSADDQQLAHSPETADRARAAIAKAEGVAP